MGRSSPASSAGVKTRRRRPGQPGVLQRGDGGCHPAVNGLEGVAPRAYIGNYRVFNVPARRRSAAAAAPTARRSSPRSRRPLRTGWTSSTSRAAARRPIPDGHPIAGRDQCRERRCRARHLGRKRPRLLRPRHGRLALHGPGRDQRRRDGQRHVFRASLSSSRRRPRRMPFVPDRHHAAVVDLGEPADRRRRLDHRRASRQLCAAAPAARLRGSSRSSARGGCSFSVKAAHAREAGAIGHHHRREPAGDPTFRSTSALSGRHDLRPRRRPDPPAAAGSGGRVTLRFTRDIAEVPTTWAGVPTSFSSAGLTAFGHKLKPDISAPGAQIISSTIPSSRATSTPSSTGRASRRRTSRASAALLLQRHPSWTPQQVKSALMSTAGPAFGRHDAGRTRHRCSIEGAGLANVAAADTPFLFTDPQSLSFGDLVAGEWRELRRSPSP